MIPHFEQDGVTLYHGDCAEVLPAAGVKANLILTSPPYDNLRTYGGHGFDFDRVADACVGALADGGVLVWVVADATVDGSETGTSFRQALGFMERGLKLHDTMIYSTPILKNPSSNRYQQSFEYMFVFSSGVLSTFNGIEDKANKNAGQNNYRDQIGRRQDGTRKRNNGVLQVKQYGLRTNVWSVMSGFGHSAPDFNEAHKHPAIFPLALAKDHITTWTNPGDVVLDPMAGSGTTLRAAKNLGRKAVGVEIHGDYLHIITERMAQSVMGI